MKTLNLYEAKTQLSALVDAAEAGEEIVIAKNGRPMAKLVPFQALAKREPRKPSGTVKVLWIAEDFDAPDAEAAAFLEQSLEDDLK